jgi:hypothetical protein
MSENVYFLILFIIGIVFFLIYYNIFLKINSNKKGKIYKIISFIVTLLTIIILSINGWNGERFGIIVYIFIFGLIIFICSLYSIIKFKKFNYLVFIPFLLIIVFFAGSYYGDRHHRKIQQIADDIKMYCREDDSISIEKLINNINVPKNMDIIKENGEIIIFYKDLIYFVNRNRYLDIDHFMKIIEENDVIINDNKDLVYYVLKEGYLEVNKR